MPRSYYDPGLDILYKEDFRGARGQGPLDTREAVEAFLRNTFHHNKLVRATFTVDPEKRAVFLAFLSRCGPLVRSLGGRIEVKAGTIPGNMDIHIYTSSLVFDNTTDPNFLRDLGRVAHMLLFEPHEKGLHIQIGIPFYNLEYWKGDCCIIRIMPKTND